MRTLKEQVEHWLAHRQLYGSDRMTNKHDYLVKSFISLYYRLRAAEKKRGAK